MVPDVFCRVSFSFLKCEKHSPDGGTYERLTGISAAIVVGPALSLLCASFFQSTAFFPLYPMEVNELLGPRVQLDCIPTSFSWLVGRLRPLTKPDSCIAINTTLSWGRLLRKVPKSSHLAWLAAQSNALEVRNRPRQKKA